MEEKKDAKQYAQEEAKKLRAQVEGKKNSTQKPQQTQMSYEQLNNIAHQLSEQNMQLRRQLQVVDMSNFFKRLDYLFKVVETAHMFSEEFADACVQEIESSLTITQGDSQDEEPQEQNPPQNTEEEDIGDLEDEDSEDEDLTGIHP